MPNFPHNNRSRICTPIHISSLTLVQVMSHFCHTHTRTGVTTRFSAILMRHWVHTVCPCEHTGDPLQSNIKEVQILTITMPMIVGHCQTLSGCQHLFRVTWSLLIVLLFCVCIPHTGPPLPDVLPTWPQHQGRELWVQHLLSFARCDGMHTFVAHGYALWKRFPHQTVIAYILPFSVTLYTLLQSNGCHVISLLMSSLLFLSDITIFSQGRPILASACQNHSGG